MDTEGEAKGEGFYPPSAQALNAGRMLLFPDVAGEGSGGVPVAEPGADGGQADAIRQAKEEVFGRDEDGAEAAPEPVRSAPKLTETGGAGKAAGSAAPAGGAPGSDASAWENQPLPAGHPMASKYKTLGDFTRGYGDSSTEAKRLAESNKHYRTFMQSLKERGVLGPRGLVAPQAGSTTLPGSTALPRAVLAPGAEREAAKDYYGFPSLEAWKAHYTQIMQTDPLRAVTDSMVQRAKHDPSYAKELQQFFAPVVEEKLQPFKEQHQQAQRSAEVAEVRSAGATFFAAHPELNDPNNPIAKAMDEFMGKAGWHEADLETGEPGLLKAARALKPYGLTPFEVAFNKVQAELLPLQVKASNERLGAHRAKAETARPSGAGKAQTKATTPLEIARNIAAETGITDEATIQEMAEAMTERGT